MRHKNAFQKLSRTPAHRRALFRNLATALVLNNRITTTLPKAKELKRIADKLVTLGKRNTLHSRRQAMAYLMVINREADYNAHKLSAVHQLFTVIAPRYVERNGGYTRVLRLGNRSGDNAEMAIIEFVEAELPVREQKRSRRVVKAEVEEPVAVQ
jgi:large subunit ribosomal protein L17